MKFLVLGASGMAGHTISMYLQEQGHDVLGFDQKKVAHCESVVGVARDTGFLRKLIKEGKFDSVVNCIGILNQFAEQNHELAAFLNAYFPHFLASVTEGSDTQVIHMEHGLRLLRRARQYREDDLRDGTTFYDRLKSARRTGRRKKHYLAQLDYGPDINPAGIGLFNGSCSSRAKSKAIRKRCGRADNAAIGQGNGSASQLRAHGLYNMVYKEPISKFDLLSLMNKKLRRPEIIIHPADAFVCDKSLVGHVSNSRI
jgi:dTDP-4-dehydrorhamnose reductase